MLEANGLQADRRTVYSNVELLQDFGVDIINKTGGNGGYYIGSRDFQLEELKLLIDAVQSSKFVTEKSFGAAKMCTIPSGSSFSR